MPSLMKHRGVFNVESALDKLLIGVPLEVIYFINFN